MKTITDIRAIMRESTGDDKLFVRCFEGCQRQISGARRELAKIRVEEARKSFEVFCGLTNSTTARTIIADKYNRSERWVYNILEMPIMASEVV